jgi:hypothetical protein
MKFKAELLVKGKNATGLPVPDNVLEGLNAGKRPKVVATINGYRWRTSIGSVDGEAMLPVSAEVRDGAGIKGGDTVEADLEVDTEPRAVVVPDDFAAALNADDAAKQAFDKLTYSHQRQHVLAIETAKTAETRQRRIEKSIATLREGKG